MICAAYGVGDIAERIVWKWCARFKTADLDLEDQEHLGRSSKTDEDYIKTLSCAIR